MGGGKVEEAGQQHRNAASIHRFRSSKRCVYTCKAETVLQWDFWMVRSTTRKLLLVWRSTPPSVIYSPPLHSDTFTLLDNYKIQHSIISELAGGNEYFWATYYLPKTGFCRDLQRQCQHWKCTVFLWRCSIIICFSPSLKEYESRNTLNK